MIKADKFDDVIVENLNINSISSTFDEIKLMSSDLIDVIIIIETKHYD